MGFHVERITCGAFSSSSKGASSRLYSPLLVQRSGAPLQDLSKTTGWRSSCRLALSRETPWTTGWRSSRLAGTQKAEGSVALPSGADPRTGQRAPTQEPDNLKGETCFCPGVLSSPCPGLQCRGFPGSGSLVLRSCSGGFLFVLCSASCFFPLAAGVTFQLPAGGTSGQVSFLFGRRPKNCSRGERTFCHQLGDKTLPSFR